MKIFLLFCSLLSFLRVHAHEETRVQEHAHLLSQLEQRNQQTPGSSSDEWLLDVREATIQKAFPMDGNIQNQVRQKVNSVHKQHPMVRVYVLVSSVLSFDAKDARLQDWFTSHQQSLDEGPRVDDPEHYANEVVSHWTEGGERSESYKIILLHFQQVVNGALAYWDVHYGLENAFTEDFTSQLRNNLRLLVNNSSVALNPSSNIYDNIRLVGLAIDNEGAKQSKYNIKTTIGDTLMTLNKIYIPTHMRHDPIFKFIPSDSTTAFVNIKLKVVSAEHKTGVFYPSNGYLKLDKNQSVTLDLDSLEEGKYQIQCEGSNSCLVNYFYVRKTKAKIPCRYCGRELELNLSRLKLIYPVSKIGINDKIVAIFNEGIEKFDLNSCTRLAHLLSQSYVESAGFSAKIEDIHYTLWGIYNAFRNQSNGSGAIMMQQSFIDNKEYLKYVAITPHYKIDTTKSNKTNYIHGETSNFSNSYGSVTFAKTVTLLSKKGNYEKVTNYSSKTKDSLGQNLLNFVYNNKNGNNNDNDGFLYRGRGLIQLTGKDNYSRVEKILAAAKIKDFSIVENPDTIANDIRIGILSAFAFIKMRFNKNIGLIDSYDSPAVTKLINAGELESDQRATLFNNYIQFYYYGCK